MTKYPSKEEIMITPYQLKTEFVKRLTEWRDNEYKKNWKVSDKDGKGILLARLVNMLSGNCANQVKVKYAYQYYYQPETQTIYLDRNNPSIVSTLHEFGHHLLGANELTVCRFSVWLFKECFPEAFQKLKWKGHMLIK